MTMTETEILTVSQIPLDNLHPAEDNPRTQLGDLEEMAASIRSVGILQPLVVAPLDDQVDHFRIVAGHRRYAAAALAELERVPAIIRVDLVATEARQEAMVVENLHRKDLTPLERARGFQQLVEGGRNQREVAELVGVSQPTVSKSLSLLELGEREQGWVDAGTISQDLGLRLAALPKAARKEALQYVHLVEEHHPEDLEDGIETGLACAEQDIERKKKVAEDTKKLKDAGVTIYAEDAELPVGTQDLGQLHWLKLAEHKKAPCRIVQKRYGRLVEMCTDPKSHPRPKTARRGAKAKGDPETERLIGELGQASERRREWLAEGELKRERLLPMATTLLLQAEIYHVLPEVCKTLGLAGTPTTSSGARVPARRERGEGLLPKLMAWIDDDTAKWERLLLAVASVHHECAFEDLKTVDWQGKPIPFGIDKRQNAEAQGYLKALEELGYEPANIELRFVGLEERLFDAPGADPPVDGTGADAQTPSSTGAEVAPDQPAAGDHPIGQVRPKGKKFMPSCTEHGDLNTGNTTEAMAQLHVDKHMLEEHGIDLSDEAGSNA